MLMRIEYHDNWRLRLKKGNQYDADGEDMNQSQFIMREINSTG